MRWTSTLIMISLLLLSGCEQMTTLSTTGSAISLVLYSPNPSASPLVSPSPVASPSGMPSPSPSIGPSPSPMAQPQIRPYGDAHACALSRYGAVFCWGLGNAGALGRGTQTSSNSPVQVVGVGGSGFLGSIVDLTASLSPCALSASGAVYCWGTNQDGILGSTSIPISSYSATPVQVVGVGGSGMLSGIRSVSGGSRHVCALANTGSVYCWGNNTNGKLGNNSTLPSSTPVQVVGVGGTGFLTGINRISAGFDHTCAVSTGGNVYCWGDNISGQLGNNTAAPSSSPVQVVGIGGSGFLSGMTEISTGIFHSCALNGSGNVFCWGGNPETSMTPVQKPGVGGSGFLTGVNAMISSSWSDQCALTTAGGLFCWGDNSVGQIGNNSILHADYPSQVVGVGGSGYLSGLTAAGISYGMGCAINSAGAVYCWGSNQNGQLGNGGTTDSLTPVRVVGVGGSGNLAL